MVTQQGVHMVERFFRSLRANRHVALLEQPSDDFLHVVQIVGALNLRIMVVIAGLVVTGHCLAIVFRQLNVTISGYLLRFHLGHCDRFYDLLPFDSVFFASSCVLVLLSFDVVQHFLFFAFERLNSTLKLTNSLIFRLQECIDQLSFVILLVLLLRHLLDLQVDEFDLFCELFGFGVLRVMVPLELRKHEHIVALNEALEAQT